MELSLYMREVKRRNKKSGKRRNKKRRYEGTKADELERSVPFGTSSQDGCEKAGTALGYQRRNGCKAL